MSEQLGLALVLLVAIVSVASVLFLTLNSPTGFLTTQTITCAHVRCPGHAQAYPLVDAQGRLIRTDQGTFVCVCPRR
jgi:hypothetical protein